MTFTNFGFFGSALVSRIWMRDDRSPGTTRYRRSICGCGEYGHKQELQAFHPKWCSSSPVFGISTRPTIVPYDFDSGSTSTTPIASGPPFLVGFSIATYASFSAGASIAILGEG